MRGQASIAIVEAGHIETSVGQFLAKFIRPPQHLKVKPHEHQKRFARCIAKGLERDLDVPVRGVLRDWRYIQLQVVILQCTCMITVRCPA